MKRNPIFLTTVVTFAAMAGLTGCSMFHHKSEAYTTAAESRPLEVPPDLDSPPSANELLVPPAGSGPAAPAAGVASAPATAPAAPAPPSHELRVADNPTDAWTKIGPALEGAKIGKISARDESAHTYVFDFDAPIPKPDAEQHWYTSVVNHLGFGEGDPVKAHLFIQVFDDGSGKSIVGVAGPPGDKAATAASLRVLQVLHNTVPGATLTTPPPPAAVASAAPAAAAAPPPSAAPPAAASNELRAAESARGVWTKLGPALERAKLGTISARDENAYTYTFDYDAPLPKPESERHWYNHLGIGGGDPVKTRLAISVVDEGGGASRIDVAGNPGDRTAAAAAQHLIQELHDTIPGTSLVATAAPAAPAVTSALPPTPVASAAPASPPPASPPAMASAPPPAAAVSSAPPPIAGVSTGPTELHVADTVPNTWTRVGLALERAQLGALSGRDENAHTYTLDFSATLTTNAEGEHHWYTKVLHPFGGGGESKSEQITRRLTVRVAEDAGGARVTVSGDGTDKETMDAARHVTKVLSERLT